MSSPLSTAVVNPPPIGWGMPIDQNTDWSHVDFLTMFLNAAFEKVRLCPGIAPAGGIIQAAPFLPLVTTPTDIDYRITAILPDGQTDFSPAAIAHIPALTYYGTTTAHNPSGATLPNFSDFDYHNSYGVKLSWTAVTGAIGYRIWVHTAGSIFAGPQNLCVAMLPPTLTSWIVNGSPSGDGSNTNLADSAHAPMSALTVALADANTFTAQVGNDITLVSTSFAQLIAATIASVQGLVFQCLRNFCDPAAGSSVAAINRPLLDWQPFDDLVGHSGAALPGILENTIGSKLWRRKRPRTVREAVIPPFDLVNPIDRSVWWKSGFKCLVTPQDEQFFTANAHPVYLAHFKGLPKPLRFALTFVCDGTDWNHATLVDGVSPDWFEQPDILDSELPASAGTGLSDAVGTGSGLPGTILAGDIVGPWLFNQLRDALNLMSRTFSLPVSGSGMVGADVDIGLYLFGVQSPGLTLARWGRGQAEFIPPGVSGPGSGYVFAPGTDDPFLVPTPPSPVFVYPISTTTHYNGLYQKRIYNFDHTTSQLPYFFTADSAVVQSGNYPTSDSRSFVPDRSGASFSLIQYPFGLSYDSDTDFLLAYYGYNPTPVVAGAPAQLGVATAGINSLPHFFSNPPYYDNTAIERAIADLLPFQFLVFESIHTSAGAPNTVGLLMGTRVYNPGAGPDGAFPFFIFPPASVTTWSNLTYVGGYTGA